MVEEAAFEIFIPCRLMALSAVDRMELGKARRERRRRKFSCEWVLWRRREGERRGRNIFWKEATKGHYSDDGRTDGGRRRRAAKKRRKKFYRET